MVIRWKNLNIYIYKGPLIAKFQHKEEHRNSQTFLGAHEVSHKNLDMGYTVILVGSIKHATVYGISLELASPPGIFQTEP